MISRGVGIDLTIDDKAPVVAELARRFGVTGL